MGRKMLFKVRSIIFTFLCCFAAVIGSVSNCDAGETGSFTGSWSANGSREILDFGSERKAALLKLQGHVNLRDGIGRNKDYWSECIGLADSVTGSDIRCVWTGSEGSEIYVVLKAREIAQGTEVIGEFVGGTKDASGISGSLSFTWSTMFTQRAGKIESVGGYAKELKGSYTLP